MPKYKPLPPLERLHELLEVVQIPPEKYGIWSGLVWKVKRNGTKGVGGVAGTPHRDPNNPDRVNWTARIDGTDYYVSRVIYYMTRNKDPRDAQVDHEDQNWLNNNVWNLRLDIDGSIQMVNVPIRRDNTSGVIGVNWNKTAKKWQAAVQIKDKRKHLGYFTCKVEAARVVRDKWIELGWDKKGRELPELDKVQCGCSRCSANS